MSAAYFHDSAVIDEGATVGEGTKVWHFTHVMGGAVIGRDCSLGQNVFVGRDVLIGDGCKIQNNVSVYEGVTLEDQVFCGPSVVFTNVKNPRAPYPTPTERFGKTLVQKGATLGANATILCGTVVGEWAFVGAGAVITADVAAYALMAGVPARRIGWVCQCGQVLTVTECAGTCAACSRRYRELDPNTLKEEPR